MASNTTPAATALRPSKSVPRVILADDHKIMVEALRKLLEPYCDVVATVSDGLALLDVAAALKPDVILIDIGMPLLNGLEAGRQLKIKMPSVKFIFLTMQEDPDLAVEAMRFGASGYLSKTSTSSELLHAMRAALGGRSYVSPKIARGIKDIFVSDPTGRPRPKLPTPRQCEVVQLLAEGKTLKETADVLQVTPRTVAFHKYRTMRRLGLNSSAELIQFAIKNRIVVT